MTLDVDIQVQLGRLALEVAFGAEAGTVLTVLGPNGAGKTTLLRALAGLQPIDRGTIHLGDSTVDDPATGMFVPPERRRVGMMFQDYLLFGHLTVVDNIAFGPRRHGTPKERARGLATTRLEQLGLMDLARAKPRELSGGQAQRVALARAMASEPQLLLLDEPFAALDASTRPVARRDLRRSLAEVSGTTVVVTHDPLDALALADQVLVLESGRVTQLGTIAEVTTRPRTPYVADLVGVNLLRGRQEGAEIVLEPGPGRLVVASAGTGDTLALIRPSSLSLHRNRPEGTARNQWPLTIAGIDLVGERVRVRLSGAVDLVAEITPASLAEHRLAEGQPVWASLKATDITCYPA
jgi:molybdate transport system ATP-binding protein